MKTMTIRLLLALSLCGAAASPAMCWWHWGKPSHAAAASKPKKAKKEKKVKGEKVAKGDRAPLYTVPKSLSRWHGGGPGPAGAGVK
jgi:hypothetical protein